MRRLISTFLALASAASLVACGESGTPTQNAATSAVASATASSVARTIHLLVLGDSIPFNSNDDCPGCTGFADEYKQALAKRTGREVAMDNRSRHDSAQLGDLITQVGTDTETQRLLAAADVLVINIGFNNVAPWKADQPCGGSDQVDDPLLMLRTVGTYTNRCIDQTVVTYRDDYDTLFADLKTKARPGAALIALSQYNDWTGWARTPGYIGRKQTAVVERLMVHMYDKWNSLLCASATEHGMICGDVYNAFNGPDGRRAAGALLADDYTHPSQAGNDKIAEVLEGIDVSSATGS
jgi:lysophospholipase L1-like esterase